MRDSRLICQKSENFVMLNGLSSCSHEVSCEQNIKPHVQQVCAPWHEQECLSYSEELK